MQDKYQEWLRALFSHLHIWECNLMLWLCHLKTHSSDCWTGCVSRWWHPNRQGGKSIVTWRLWRESLCSGVCATSYTWLYTPTARANSLKCPLSSSLAYCLTPSGIPHILLSSFMRNNKLILLTHLTNCFLAYLRTAATQLISCDLTAHYCKY